MLSYPIGEAETLLRQKLNTAQTTRRNCEEDLEFLREQITVGPTLLLTTTPPIFFLFFFSCFSFLISLPNFSRLTIQTMEVAIARVYNWDVVQKRKEKEGDAAAKNGKAVAGSGG